MSAVAAAQEPAPKMCSEVLRAPSVDSVAVRVVMRVRADDPGHPLSPIFAETLVGAVRDFIKLPSPLGTDAYESDADTTRTRAYASLRTAFAATLTRDGHIRDVRPMGGSRNAGFDDAVTRAIVEADSAGQLAPPTLLSMEERDYRFSGVITAEASPGAITPATFPLIVSTMVMSEPFPDPKRPPIAPFVEKTAGLPLFVYRTPWRSITRPLRQVPGRGNLRYPWAMRNDHRSGDVWLSYVVEANGEVDRRTMTVLRSDHEDFASAVRDALQNFRFWPMMVEGCEVRSLTRQAIAFQIR